MLMHDEGISNQYELKAIIFTESSLSPTCSLALSAQPPGLTLEMNIPFSNTKITHWFKQSKKSNLDLSLGENAFSIDIKILA